MKFYIGQRSAVFIPTILFGIKNEVISHRLRCFSVRNRQVYYLDLERLTSNVLALLAVLFLFSPPIYLNA